MNAMLPSRVKISEKVVFSDLGDSGVLLNLTDEQYYELDDIGAKIWQLFQQHDDPGIVIKHLLDEYNIDEATLRRDVAELIEAMKASGLLFVS